MDGWTEGEKSPKYFSNERVMFPMLITHSAQMMQHTRKTLWSVSSHVMYEQTWSYKRSTSKVKSSASKLETRIVNSIVMEPGHKLIASFKVNSIFQS